MFTRQINLVILALFTLTACTPNYFVKYYKGPADARAFPAYDASYSSPDGQIPVYTALDIHTDVLKLISKGYIPFGESSFYAPERKVSMDQLQDASQKVGAQSVLIQSHYRDTLTGAVPLVMPNNSTSYTSGTATAYGPGGSATAYGNSTTNTYGTSVAMMPYSVSRSDYEAVYFFKGRIVLGIYPADLTDYERQQLQTNLAVRVAAVTQDSPAYLADVLPGDYLLDINTDPITDKKTYYAAINKYHGQDVTLRLIRNGKIVIKKVHILEPPPSPAQH